MARLTFILLILTALPVFVTAEAEGKPRATVVADSVTREPLANASIFRHDGRFIGISDPNGALHYVSVADYPITIRYMGYYEKTETLANTDTIFLSENVAQLPEVVVETKQKQMLHILAYMREYSTLASYTDTVTMFREKMVDFMLPADDKSSMRGWRNPRILNSRSYYRFSNADGLDSVSNKCNNHFTWSDWVGIPPSAAVPTAISSSEHSSDTVAGKYSPGMIWLRRNDRLSVDVDVLADTTGRKWVPEIKSFFRKGNIDFEQFRLHLNYSYVAGNSIDPLDLTGYSFNIESRGRGHGMFRFNRHDEPFFVTTYTEVYLLDKEFIPVKEARKWENRRFRQDELRIYEPMEAPELSQPVQALIDRVNDINTDDIRLALSPDHRLVGRNVSKQNFSFGNRALSMLKTLTGIYRYKANRNMKRDWQEFRKEQITRNSRRDTLPEHIQEPDSISK